MSTTTLRVGCNLTASGVSRNATAHFPDPFMDMASLAMPTTIREALEWCEFICSANGTYSSALGRIVSYFITDVEIIAAPGTGKKSVGREEREKYLSYLHDTFGIASVLRTVAMDFMVYGNSLTSLITPFRRYLSCGRCGSEFPLRKVAETSVFRYSWQDYEFHAYCPRCHYSGAWKHIDRRAIDTGKLSLKRWSPHEIDIIHDEPSGESAYYWNISEQYKQQIRRGDLFQLERARWEIVTAVKRNQGLLFDSSALYHMREEPLAGQNTQGWGFSRVLTNFRQAWYQQILKRYNEAIAMDYVVPFRVITPEARGGQGGEINDPLLSIGLGAFTARVEAMLAKHRQDPFRWNILPTPAKYQAFGGEARDLSPTDLLELAETELLSAIGMPVDLYRAQLTMQAAPSTLRAFQAFWAPLIYSMNQFLTKTVNRIGEVMGWEQVACRLAKVSHADDLNRQMAKLQLMMGGQTSRTSGLASVDMDFEEEERRKIEEEKIVAELQQEAQEDLERAAVMDEMAMPPQPGAGGPPTGDPSTAGPPAGPAPGTGSAVQQFLAGQPLLPHQPTTPTEIMQIAETIASEAMSLPDSQRQSFLIKLKKENEIIHSIATAKIEEIRRSARMQGGDMLLQQQQAVKQAQLSAALQASRRKLHHGRLTDRHSYKKPGTVS